MTSERSQRPVNWSDVDRILADPKSKDFRDMLDRAASMHLTGGFPSHLRAFFTGALRVISSGRDEHEPVAPAVGSLRIAQDVVQRLGLDEHPMVLMVRQKQAEGWRMRPSLGPNHRRPFTKVFMYRGDDRLTVQIDGSILDHWPGERPMGRTPPPARARRR